MGIYYISNTVLGNVTKVNKITPLKGSQCREKWQEILIADGLYSIQISLSLLILQLLKMESH